MTLAGQVKADHYNKRITIQTNKKISNKFKLGQ